MAQRHYPKEILQKWTRRVLASLNRSDFFFLVNFGAFTPDKTDARRPPTVGTGEMTAPESQPFMRADVHVRCLIRHTFGFHQRRRHDD